ATGRRVAAACGERLIPCTLELGGKAAAIVCADADLERTANALVWGAFANAGQVCASVERVYVHHAVYEELCARVVEKTRVLRTPATVEPGKVPDVGAMTSPSQIDHVAEQVAQAVTGGARVRVGGQRLAAGGWGFEPTVLTDCRQDMAVMRSETFGPVLPLM